MVSYFRCLNAKKRLINFNLISIRVQLNVLLNRLCGEPIGFTVIGIFVIDKNTILTVWDYRWVLFNYAASHHVYIYRQQYTLSQNNLCTDISSFIPSFIHL